MIETAEKPDWALASFFTLTLSGNSGRVIFRDFSQLPLREVAKNIIAWFEDLSIVSRDGKRIIDRHKFWGVLGATVRDLKDVPSPTVATMWNCVIRRMPIPPPVAAQTLVRVRIDVIQNNTPRHARLGLLRAFLLRHPPLVTKGFKMSASVDNSLNNQPAYLCGRIMALLAAIQEVALGDVGAGVVQRYYAAASTTPALVLGRMIKTAQVAHIPKASGDDKSKRLVHKFDEQIQTLMSQMKTPPPSTLTLEEQTLFALGFYQQQADRYTSSKKSDLPTGDELKI